MPAVLPAEQRDTGMVADQDGRLHRLRRNRVSLHKASVRRGDLSIPLFVARHILNGWSYGLRRARDHGIAWYEMPVAFVAIASCMVIDHIDHIVAVAGIDHVGLGSDFASTFLTPEGVKDAAGFPNITAELVMRGYSDDDIRKILGENALRVLTAVERVSQELRGRTGE